MKLDIFREKRLFSMNSYWALLQYANSIQLNAILPIFKLRASNVLDMYYNSVAPCLIRYSRTFRELAWLNGLRISVPKRVLASTAKFTSAP